MPPDDPPDTHTPSCRWPWPPWSARSPATLGTRQRARQGLRRAHRGGDQAGGWRIHQGQRGQDARLAELRAGLRGDALQQAEPGQRGQRQGSGPGVVVRPRIDPRRRGDPARGGWDHVRVGLVEHRARHRRPHRQEDLDVRSEGRARSRLQGLLRRGQPGRGAPSGQGVRRGLRRTADRARRCHGPDGVGERHDHRPLAPLHHHRRAAGVQGQGHHRQRGRRVRRARLHHRLRCEHRRPEMALVHRARRPEQAVRGRVDGESGQDLGSQRQVLGGRRRRHGLGHADIRSPAQPDVRGHRQRLALGAEQAQPRRRRQPVPRFHRRAQSRHRCLRLALPGEPRRQLGLHLHPAHDPRRPQDQRSARAR